MSMSVSHDRTTAISLRLANSDLATYSRRLWDEERCGLCVRQWKPYSVLIIPPGWYVRFSWAGAHQPSCGVSLAWGRPCPRSGREPWLARSCADPQAKLHVG